MSLIPLGESVGQNIVTPDNKLLISPFGFIVGYGAKLVEPGITYPGSASGNGSNSGKSWYRKKVLLHIHCRCSLGL